MRAGGSIIPELPLDQDLARRAVGIYNKLKLPDVPGTPTLAEAGADWFRDIVAALFGSLNVATQERYIREVFGLVPKKNSKTTNGAGLMVTALLLNERPRAEFVLTGPSHETSELAFSQAQGMILNDEYLLKRMHVQEHLKTITDRKTKAKLKVKTFAPEIATGPKPAGILIDELHLVAKIKDAAKIIGQLRGGMISQAEAFLIMITTQSDDEPVGIFRAELNKARAIRDGRLQGVPMLPVLYEFPDDIQKLPPPGELPAWYDSSLWWMVTPNRDKSITIARLIQDFEAAKATGKDEVRRWASQHLNIEIGLGLKSDRWVGADHWEDATDPAITFEYLLEWCDVIVAGVDGGGLDDLFGLTFIGRHRITRKWLWWGHAWVHHSVLELRKSEAAKLRDLEKAGELTIVTMPDADIEEAVDMIAQVDEMGLLAQVGLDPMGVGAVVDALADRGIEGDDRIKGISQGWKLNGAIKTTERKLANGTLKHGGQLLMSWAVGNAKVEPRGNAVTITKQAAGTAKIDPLMAGFNAVVLMSLNPEGQQSVFEALARGAQEQSSAEQAQSDGIDWDILADPKHPLFQEHKRRWEAQADADDDED